MPSKLEPINVNDDLWLYAERKGLCVVMQARNGKDYVGTYTAYVPWKIAGRAVDRWRREKSRKKVR